MARLARLYVPGMPQLLVQRGNNKQRIYSDDGERLFFLECLRDAIREYGVVMHAYVLMPDHFHLVATPSNDTGMGRALQSLGRRYVGWFNQKHGRTGTLWEGRYRSTVIDPDRYLLGVHVYVECNPVRAAMVEDAAAYRWSSAAHHLGLRSDPLITDHAAYWALGNTPFERQASYKSLLERVAMADELERIRAAMNKGWLLTDGTRDPSWLMDANRRPTSKARGRPARRNEVTKRSG